MVDANLAGEHDVKGKAEPQKVYRLDAVRHGATRFEAAVSRGLTTFVGREHELDMLERALVRGGVAARIVDLVAEPGMGKSRLSARIPSAHREGTRLILIGSCSPDGQQTPFLPFIEVVRGSFCVSPERRSKTLRKSSKSELTAFGLHLTRNLRLLLHLLGLRGPS